MLTTSFKGAMLGAGAGFYFFAFAVGYGYPAIVSKNSVPKVKDINGKIVEVKPYTAEEKLGRKIYIKEACWICHSQFVRPIGGDEKRYGPVSQAGEFAYDTPHTLGTRRIGPDLAREGGKRTDGWQYAHLANPQAMTPGSIMPKYVWYFEKGEDNKPDITKPTKEGKALIAYLQRLGTSIGDWRNKGKKKSSGTSVASGSMEFTPEMADRGKEVYTANCMGCHGTSGMGDGPAAVALNPKPRNFVKPKWKGDGSNASVYDAIANGLAGSAMPPWKDALSADQLQDVSAYVKSLEKK